MRKGRRVPYVCGLSGGITEEGTLFNSSDRLVRFIRDAFGVLR